MVHACQQIPHVGEGGAKNLQQPTRRKQKMRRILRQGRPSKERNEERVQDEDLHTDNPHHDPDQLITPCSEQCTQQSGSWKQGLHPGDPRSTEFNRAPHGSQDLAHRNVCLGVASTYRLPVANISRRMIVADSYGQASKVAVKSRFFSLRYVSFALWSIKAPRCLENSVI
eukprot:5340058-Amphidinium_carterae.1